MVVNIGPAQVFTTVVSISGIGPRRQLVPTHTFPVAAAERDLRLQYSAGTGGGASTADLQGLGRCGEGLVRPRQPWCPARPAVVAAVRDGFVEELLKLTQQISTSAQPVVGS
jgi:hypothetical protein